MAKTPTKTPATRAGAKPATTRSPRTAAAKSPAKTPAKQAAKPSRRALAKSVARSGARAARGVSSSTLWSIGAVVAAAGAGFAAFLTRGRIADAVAKASGTAEGHVPTDLLDPKRNADDRAVADFRPDMDAAMTAAEREALRPATGAGPSMISTRGTMNSQTGPAN